MSEMIVTAALCYYDDDLELLDRCLRSLPVVADKVVVVDGRYGRYMPGASPTSPRAHHAFIRDTCRELALPLILDVPSKPWAGQVEKRSHLLALAAKGTDWIVGADADHVLHGVRQSVREELAAVEVEDTVDVDFWTTPNLARPLRESAAGDWHANLAGQRAKVSAFWRALPGLRVEERHWWYTALKGEQRVWLWGGDGEGRYPRAKVHTLYAPFYVEHLCLFRQPKHIVANREFCEDRERVLRETGNEDGVNPATAASPPVRRKRAKVAA